MSKQPSQTTDAQRVDKQTLNKRLETIGWALFLIMIGGLGLVPNEQVPQGTWLIGVGLIMLGLNAARLINGIPMSGFSTVLGILALLAGLGDFFGVQLPVFPILLILIGADILLKPYFEKRQG
jgi:hypothetical protein